MTSTTLRIIRGLPGSGKSTLAELLKEQYNINNYYEADMFFMRDGEYKFYPTALGIAHKWCKSKVEESLQNNEDVIVANTFTTIKELNEYLKLTKLYDCNIVIYEVRTQFESIHNVPDEAINRMRNRWYNIPEDFEFEVNIIN